MKLNIYKASNDKKSDLFSAKAKGMKLWNSDALFNSLEFLELHTCKWCMSLIAIHSIVAGLKFQESYQGQLPQCPLTWPWWPSILNHSLVCSGLGCPCVLVLKWVPFEIQNSRNPASKYNNSNYDKYPEQYLSFFLLPLFSKYTLVFFFTPNKSLIILWKNAGCLSEVFAYS